MSPQMQSNGPPDRRKLEAAYQFLKQKEADEARAASSLSPRQIRAEARKRAEEDRKKIESEQEQEIQSLLNFIRLEWERYQKTIHNAPPELLPLEASEYFNRFRSHIYGISQHVRITEAILRFERHLTLDSADASSALQAVRSAVKWLGAFAITKTGKLLKSLSVSIAPPKLSSPAKEAIEAACRSLRGTWSDNLDRSKQAIFTAHQSAGSTIVHFGSGKHGSVFLKIPHAIPDDVVCRLLEKLARAILPFFEKDSLVAIVDGSFQGLNYKKMFGGRIVVRSFLDDFRALCRNLKLLLGRKRPDSTNTHIHIGIPRDRDGLSAVFKGEADWDLWDGIAGNWDKRVAIERYSSAENANKEEIIKSLETKENVIIVIAHADSSNIYFPDPKPDGSSVTSADLLAHSDTISANRPLVYLFCCEVAQVSDLDNVARTLLSCGVAGVVAPQVKINPNRYADVFQHLLKRTIEDNPLAALQAAEKAAGVSDMEVWLG